MRRIAAAKKISPALTTPALANAIASEGSTGVTVLPAISQCAMCTAITRWIATSDAARHFDRHDGLTAGAGGSEGRTGSFDWTAFGGEPGCGRFFFTTVARSVTPAPHAGTSTGDTYLGHLPGTLTWDTHQGHLRGTATWIPRDRTNLRGLDPPGETAGEALRLERSDLLAGAESTADPGILPEQGGEAAGRRGALDLGVNCQVRLVVRQAPPPSAQVVAQIADQKRNEPLPRVLSDVHELVREGLERSGGAPPAGLGGGWGEADVPPQGHCRSAGEPRQQRRAATGVHPRGGEVSPEGDLEQPPQGPVEQLDPALASFLSQVRVPGRCPR